MEKVALFAFRGDATCFIHVLLNALDLADRGVGAAIVIEGEATRLVPELAKTGHPLHDLYRRAKERGLIDAVCRACSTKTDIVESVEAEGLPLVGEMSGHPAVARYLEQGFTVITM